MSVLYERTAGLDRTSDLGSTSKVETPLRTVASQLGARDVETMEGRVQENLAFPLDRHLTHICFAAAKCTDVSCILNSLIPLARGPFACGARALTESRI